MRILAREARALRRGVAIAAMVRGSCVEQPRDLEAYLVRGGVAGLCARQLGARQLGAACHSPLVLALRRARLIQAAMNEHLRRQMCEVFATLEHDGLEPIVVKGWSIARHYDAPGLRPYTDVDVFVSAAALPRARQLLRERPDAGALAVDLHGCLKGGDCRTTSYGDTPNSSSAVGDRFGSCVLRRSLRCSPFTRRSMVIRGRSGSTICIASGPSAYGCLTWNTRSLVRNENTWAARASLRTRSFAQIRLRSRTATSVRSYAPGATRAHSKSPSM